MNRSYAIDSFRLIGALCIMTLHTELPSFGYDIGSIIRLSGRWAVPFFFITTGYFMGGKISNDNKLSFTDIEKNVINLISIFIISSVIYLIYSTLSSDRLVLNIFSILLNGTYWHLWFISSMIFGYIVIWYFFSINFEKYLLIISVIIIMIALLSDSYDLFINKKISYSPMPRFLTSIPFMYIGIFLSKNKISKKQLPLWAIILFVGFVLQYIEVTFFKNIYQYSTYEHQLLIGTVISTIALFVICLSLNIKDNIVSALGRKYSLFIYLYHLLGYWFIRKILDLLHLSNTDAIKIFIPVIGFFFILFVAILLDRFLPSIFSLLNGNLKLTVSNMQFSKWRSK